MAKYADYLAQKEEEERQTPAAPSNESGGYAAWLQAEVQRQNAENTPVKNASSFAEYLGGTAGDVVGQYGATVDQAAIDAAKQRTTYGAQAETLARNGLGQSGYGQYLEGEVYRQQQQTVRNAQQLAAQQVADAKQGYAAYLSGVKQQNAQGTTAALDALNNAVTSGMTLQAAKEYLSGGQYAPYLDEAVERYNAAYKTQQLNKINNYGAVTSVDTIDTNSASYEEEKAALQENNARLFQAAVGDNFTGIQQYIDSLAEKKKTGQEVWNKMSGEEKAHKIREWLIEARNNGDITTEQLNAIKGSEIIEQMEEKISSGNIEGAQNIRENAKTEYEEGVISEAQYNKINEDYDAMIQRTGGISINKITEDVVGSSERTAQPVATVKYFDNEKGKESIKLTYGALTTGEFVPSQTIGSVTIGFVGDKLAVKNGSGVYFVDYVKTSDNKKFVEKLKSAASQNKE